MSEKMYTRESWKVILDMINPLFLAVWAVEPTFITSFANASMASCAILSNFFEEHWTQNHPQCLSRLSRALFPTNFLEIAVYKCSVRKGSSFCDIGTLEFPKLLSDAACRWRPGQLSCRLKIDVTDFFWDFAILTLRRPYLCPSKGNQHGVSI